MTTIFNENASSSVVPMNHANGNSLAGKKSSTGRRKAFGRIDMNARGNEEESLQKKAMKRKPVLKKGTSQVKHTKQIQHSSPDHPEQDAVEMSTPEDPAMSVVDFEDDATEQQHENIIFSMLHAAKPVVDPNDSMEYENELKMLEEFYHIQYGNDDECECECSCDQLEGVQEEEVQEENESVLKESELSEGCAPDMQEIFKS